MKKKTSSTAQAWRSFPGQYYDAETGLHQNYFRDYDPRTGRYVEPDPIGLAGGTNVYSYVSANPIHSIDPTGQISLGDVGGAIVGFGDGVSSSLTFGIFSTKDIRNKGIIDECSGYYKLGKYTGNLWGMATYFVAGLNGGSQSVFWSGKEINMARAAEIGTTLEITPIGWFLNQFGNSVPYPVWKAASATFSANVKGTAVKVGTEVGTIWRTIEQPILNWRGIPITYIP